MKKIYCTILAILLIAGMSQASPLLWRGAKTMSSGKFIGMLGLSYTTICRGYNWTDEEWTDLPDASKTDVIGAHFMLGYAPMDKWEVMAHIPVMSKSKDTLSSFGLQDAWIKTRYGLMGGEGQPYLTGVLGLRFPTSSEDASPALDDRTIDIAGGFLFMYKMAPMVLHLKAGYWYNMKNDAEIDVGDIFEGIFKIDYIFTKQFKAFLNFNLMQTLAAKDSTGATIEHTDKTRLNIIPGVIFKPMPGLNLRPKFIYPLEMVNKGGSNFAWKVGFDVWFVPK